MVATLTEQWDELARLTMEQEYQRAGVEPGDHLGYFLKRSEEHDALLRKLLGIPESKQSE